jgi:hypothetical protein
MSDHSTTAHGATTAAQPPATIDVSTITDTPTRRAVRAVVQLNQQLTETVRQQQLEIEALLQMMCEKHVGSVGEFKRHMLKLQSNDARSERIHGQIAGMAAPHHPAAAKPAAVAQPVAAQPPTTPAPKPNYGEPEIDRPRRYTL